MNNYLNQFIQKYGLADEMKIIKENVNKLTKDMEDLFDIEKIEKGKPICGEEHILKLGKIIHDKKIMFQEVARYRNIAISDVLPEKDVFLRIDPCAIDRILNNLLDNAIKYNKNGGTIEIILQQKENDIFLSIEDTGIGMDEEQQKNIYKPFYQASHKKKNIQGIGIGLTIIKKLIDSVNGKITVRSKLNEGTRFTIQFRSYHVKPGDVIRDRIEYSVPASNPVTIELKTDNFKNDRCSVLLVEDNLEMLAYLKTSLQEIYNIHTSVNGREAIELLKTISRPALIVSDIMMDEMDGYELYDQLSKNKKYACIPFIFLTARISEHDRIKGLARGAIDYFTKPFDMTQLLIKINSIVRNSQLIQESTTTTNKMKISREVKKKIRENIRRNFDNNCIKHNLSGREREIIARIINGKIHKEICEELGITHNTMKNHIKRIYQKCNVQTKVELINCLKKR
jgi:DNA-binding NarL/FixJ family response regulator/anti-sigma regulatory factor (Ser/Thr protein kinase)